MAPWRSAVEPRSIRSCTSGIAAAGSTSASTRSASARVREPDSAAARRAASARRGSFRSSRAFSAAARVASAWSRSVASFTNSGPASFNPRPAAACTAAVRTVCGDPARIAANLGRRASAAGPAGRGAIGRHRPITASRPDGLAQSAQHLQGLRPAIAAGRSARPAASAIATASSRPAQPEVGIEHPAQHRQGRVLRHRHVRQRGHRPVDRHVVDRPRRLEHQPGIGVVEEAGDLGIAQPSHRQQDAHPHRGRRLARRLPQRRLVLRRRADQAHHGGVPEVRVLAAVVAEQGQQRADRLRPGELAQRDRGEGADPRAVVAEPGDQPVEAPSARGPRPAPWRPARGPRPRGRRAAGRGPPTGRAARRRTGRGRAGPAPRSRAAGPAGRRASRRPASGPGPRPGRRGGSSRPRDPRPAAASPSPAHRAATPRPAPPARTAPPAGPACRGAPAAAPARRSGARPSPRPAASRTSRTFGSVAPRRVEHAVDPPLVRLLPALDPVGDVERPVGAEVDVGGQRRPRRTARSRPARTTPPWA